MSLRPGIGTITAVVIFALDQVSKLWIVFGLDLIAHGVIPVWPGFVTFRMAWNEGINFGLFANSSDALRWMLVAISIVISGWVIWWVLREGGSRWMRLSAGLLVGGALGNVIDRIAYGAVADFLNVTCCGIENPYSFNVADISIFAGAFGLIVFSGGKDGDADAKPG